MTERDQGNLNAEQVAVDPFRQNFVLPANISVADLRDPDVLSKLFGRKNIIITTQDALEIVERAGIPLSEDRSLGELTELQKRNLGAAFEKQFPTMRREFKRMAEEGQLERAPGIVNDALQGVDSTSKINEHSKSAYMIDSDKDQNPRALLAVLTGIDEATLPALPETIVSIPNLSDQLNAFAVLHEFEHDKSPRADFGMIGEGFIMARELDADYSAIRNLGDQLDPNLRDYIIKARAVSGFTEGFFNDPAFRNSDHSTGILLGRAIETGEAPTALQVQMVNKAQSNLNARIRAEFGIPDIENQNPPAAVPVETKPRMGQIMTAIDRILEKDRTGEIELSGAERELAGRVLEAASSNGFQREGDLASYTQTYMSERDTIVRNNALQEVSRDWAHEGRGYGNLLNRTDVPPENLEYMHDKALALVEKARTYGVSDDVRGQLEEPDQKVWDDLSRELEARALTPQLQSQQPEAQPVIG